jgi:hypothetical protein
VVVDMNKTDKKAIVTSKTNLKINPLTQRFFHLMMEVKKG